MSDPPLFDDLGDRQCRRCARDRAPTSVPRQPPAERNREVRFLLPALPQGLPTRVVPGPPRKSPRLSRPARRGGRRAKRPTRPAPPASEPSLCARRAASDLTQHPPAGRRRLGSLSPTSHGSPLDLASRSPTPSRYDLIILSDGQRHRTRPGPDHHDRQCPLRHYRVTVKTVGRQQENSSGESLRSSRGLRVALRRLWRRRRASPSSPARRSTPGTSFFLGRPYEPFLLED